jgi:mannose-6-phosphate isomerase-like protein (cupin superfamily)
MFAWTFQEGERFPCAGNEYVMLVPREVTDCCEVVLERIDSGGSTPPNAHLTFNQVFIILEGTAEITIGDEKRHLSAPAVAYIPKNTQHFVRNLGTAELQYVYITIWPDGIPADERRGGWRQASEEMVRDYAERGYPPSSPEA